MELRSDAFKANGEIPRRFSCQGEDVSPPLSWEAAPSRTQSFVLICEDPDAPIGTFTHWVVYDIPPTRTWLPAHLPQEPEILGARQGVNDFGNIGYSGPCPPNRPYHRYFFRLYALDTMLRLPAGSNKNEVLDAMEEHIIDSAELMGRYRKVRLTQFLGKLLGRRRSTPSSRARPSRHVPSGRG